MTFRTRVFFAFLVAVVVPIVLLAFFVRSEMTSRLTAQYSRRVQALVEVIERDIADERRSIAASLAVIRGAVVDDNRFRRAAVDRDREERRYLLDYAGNAMRLTGLDMLQIQDESGRIISSGHFRNEFDRVEPELPQRLSEAPGATALVEARAPDGPFLALATARSFQMGGKQFWIVAGVRVDRRFLERLQGGTDLTVELERPGGGLSVGEPGGPSEENWTARQVSVAYVDPSLPDAAEATFTVSHRLDELRSLRRSVDIWFVVAFVAAVVLAAILAGWLSSRVSRPLVELADKTARIDLDRLDVDFETDRNDEIGALSRLLGAMTGRLRASALRIKDAERRATVGELARQVNHDVKNGLTPIRNVFRHMAELSRSAPDRLRDVFVEREGTIDSSISYLEDLASNYARLYPRGERRPCDVNRIVRSVAADLGGTGRSATIRTELKGTPVVSGDPVSIRRVLENLVHNAMDSVEAGGGEVTVSTGLAGGESGEVARIVVADSGAGIAPDLQDKIFDDFYTTREGGTGLGLSIVRRLVMDLDGSIEVESESGRGSRFIVDLPAVGPKSGE